MVRKGWDNFETIYTSYSDLSDCEFWAIISSQLSKGSELNLSNFNPLATPSQLLDWVSIEV